MKELEDFVRQYLIDNNIPLESIRTKKNVVDLIVYGVRGSGWSNNGAALFAKRYFPNKPKNGKILTYIYEQEQKRVCETCNTLLRFDEFYPHSSRTNGISGECKKCRIESVTCWRINNPKKARLNSKKGASKYRANKLNRTPPWVDLEKIAVIYNNCPEGYQVDHIIPLQGKLASGLHVHENLQYLTPSENASKNNKYEIA